MCDEHNVSTVLPVILFEACPKVDVVYPKVKCRTLMSEWIRFLVLTQQISI